MRERRNATTEVSVSLDDNNWSLRNVGHFRSEKNIHKKTTHFSLLPFVMLSAI